MPLWPFGLDDIGFDPGGIFSSDWFWPAVFVLAALAGGVLALLLVRVSRQAISIHTLNRAERSFLEDLKRKNRERLASVSTSFSASVSRLLSKISAESSSIVYDSPEELHRAISTGDPSPPAIRWREDISTQGLRSFHDYLNRGDFPAFEQNYYLQHVLFAMISDASGDVEPSVADALYDLFILDTGRDAMLIHGKYLRTHGGDDLCRPILLLLDDINRSLSPTDIGLRMQLAEFTRRSQFLATSPLVPEMTCRAIGAVKPDRVLPGDKAIHLPGNCLFRVLVKLSGQDRREEIFRALSPLDLEIIDGRTYFSSATQALQAADPFLSHYEKDRLFVRWEGDARWHVECFSPGEAVPEDYRQLDAVRKAIKFGHKLGGRGQAAGARGQPARAWGQRRW